MQWSITKCMYPFVFGTKPTVKVNLKEFSYYLHYILHQICDSPIEIHSWIREVYGISENHNIVVQISAVFSHWCSTTKLLHRNWWMCIFCTWMEILWSAPLKVFVILQHEWSITKYWMIWIFPSLGHSHHWAAAPWCSPPLSVCLLPACVLCICHSLSSSPWRSEEHTSELQSR